MPITYIIYEIFILSRGIMNINKKNAGRRIKKIRVIDLDLNQKQFAKKLGITQPMVSKYEKGEIIPPAQILLKIAKLGKTSIEGILEGE